MNVAVVVVSWNVRDLLAQCLASVEQASAALAPGSIETVVVDNASHDGSAAMVLARFPGVQLIVNHENLGFAAACNQAFAHCSGEAVLLLNPDAALAPGCLSTLATYLQQYPRVACVGPMLVNPDGSVQSSRRRFPTLATAFVESTILQSYFPHHPHLRWFYCLDQPPDQEQEVDWLVGACLMLHRSALDQVGPLDERFFMYFDEVDWCRRAKAAGWSIAYLPQARAVHHHGQSSAQDLRRRYIHFTASKLRYYTKYYGRAGGALVRCWLLLNYLALIAEDALKLALGHRVAMRWRRIGVLASALRWSLKR